MVFGVPIFKHNRVYSVMYSTEYFHSLNNNKEREKDNSNNNKNVVIKR